MSSAVSDQHHLVGLDKKEGKFKIKLAPTDEQPPISTFQTWQLYNQGPYLSHISMGNVVSYVKSQDMGT